MWLEKFGYIVLCFSPINFSFSIRLEKRIRKAKFMIFSFSIERKFIVKLFSFYLIVVITKMTELIHLNAMNEHKKKEWNNFG